MARTARSCAKTITWRYIRTQVVSSASVSCLAFMAACRLIVASIVFKREKAVVDIVA